MASSTARAFRTTATTTACQPGWEWEGIQLYRTCAETKEDHLSTIIGGVLAGLVFLFVVIPLFVIAFRNYRGVDPTRFTERQVAERRQLRQQRGSLAPSYRTPNTNRIVQIRRTAAMQTLVSPPPKYTQLGPPGSDYSSDASSLASTPERVRGYPEGYTWDSSTEPPPSANRSSADGSCVDSPGSPARSAGSAGNAGGPGSPPHPALAEEGHSYYTFFRDDQEATGQTLPQLSPEVVEDELEESPHAPSNLFHTVV